MTFLKEVLGLLTLGTLAAVAVALWIGSGIVAAIIIGLGLLVGIATVIVTLLWLSFGKAFRKIQQILS